LKDPRYLTWLFLCSYHAAFIFYINVVITLPIPGQAKQQQWKTILTTAKNKWFPLHIMHNLGNRLITKTLHSPHKHTKRKNRSHSLITVHFYTN
jgi:hypothetical protein